MSASVALPGIPVLDFHAHFPTRAASWAADPRAEYVRRFGEARWAMVQRHLAADQEAWRRVWGFPPPDPPGDDNEMAARWAGEVARHRLVSVVFVTGGGKDRRPALVKAAPGQIVGLGPHHPFAPRAAPQSAAGA